MKRLLAPALTPAMVGVNVAKHVAWYVSYQMSGTSTRAFTGPGPDRTRV